MTSSVKKSVLLLAVATVLYSLVGIVAKVITMPASAVSFWRSVFSCLTLVLVLLVRRKSFNMSPREVWQNFLVGAFLAGNWFFYFLALKTATVSIAVVALFTYPLLTSLIEPFIFREKHRKLHLAAGLLVIFGVILTVPEFTFSNKATLGILFGLLSGASLAMRNIFSRKLVANQGADKLLVVQFMAAGVLFLPAGIGSIQLFTPSNLVYLLILGCILTTLSILFFTMSLRALSTSLASLFLSLQPVVTILMAWLLLQERPGIRTLGGGALIILAVIAVSWQHYSETEKK